MWKHLRFSLNYYRRIINLEKIDFIEHEIFELKQTLDKLYKPRNFPKYHDPDHLPFWIHLFGSPSNFFALVFEQVSFIVSFYIFNNYSW